MPHTFDCRTAARPATPACARAVRHPAPRPSRVIRPWPAWLRLAVAAWPRPTALAALALLILAAGPLLAQVTVSSPQSVLEVAVSVEAGQPRYSLRRFGETVIRPSRLGLQFGDAPSLADDLAIVGSATRAVDETWTQPWGESEKVRNHYNELRVDLGREGATLLSVVFRVYDTGLGFRYEVPADAAHPSRSIGNELTEFALAGDHRAWWTGAYLPNRYEYLYRTTPLSAIWKAVTPLTLKTESGLYLSLHEAALVDYAEMTLENIGDNTLKADLIPWSDGSRVKTSGAFVSPWRTLEVTDSAAGLIAAADLILNLNEPNRLGEANWIEPGKYVGVWWEMHIRKSTWASGPRHGANTANVKRYIDFAAKYGFKGVLVEGWNVGWDGDWIQNSELFNFTKPYPDYDFDELARYAQSKGVRIIGHHETSGGIANYESQLEPAMKYMAAHGVRAIKTGYVKQNGLIPRVDADGKTVHEWQHGQFMVRHNQKVVEAAARQHIAINTHEPIKDTGLRRTWPNWMSREGARGQEYNAWSEGNGPAHTATLPFTRMLSGPMDFTPGIFDLGSEVARRERNIPTTLAKQLALYVVIYSPLQMAADLPENYEAKPAAFQFIRDVPADWAETRALAGEIGEYVAIARRDRASADWYLGALTNGHGRLLDVPLGFLESGRRYRAQIYRDGLDAHWDNNPESILIESREISSRDMLQLRLAPGGGAAIRFVPIDQE
ncbi:MAG: glycoside hydrolase family 97 protein [Lysobacterales bacterium]